MEVRPAFSAEGRTEAVGMGSEMRDWRFVPISVSRNTFAFGCSSSLKRASDSVLTYGC